jgi:UDP-N-acetylmuramate dehydrogenase
MNMGEQAHLATTGLRGELLRDEPMSRHVSWHAGGCAERAYFPSDYDDLARFMRILPDGEPLCFVGLGSNLLVRDGGFRGTVILTHRTRALIGLEEPAGAERPAGGSSPSAIYAEAGASGAKLARFAANEAMEGAEFFAGIPGTVGGALAMNAGCHGSETWEFVERVRMIGRRGELRTRTPDEFEIGYRHVALKSARLGEDEWFAGAWLRFSAGDAARARSRIKELLIQRAATQPLGLPNAGSVFRNPPNDYAARLIESCGLKGFAIGGACVSEKHANFIVNPAGRASASDIEAVIVHVRKTVREHFGIELVTEVRIIGEQTP